MRDSTRSFWSTMRISIWISRSVSLASRLKSISTTACSQFQFLKPYSPAMTCCASCREISAARISCSEESARRGRYSPIRVAASGLADRCAWRRSFDCFLSCSRLGRGGNCLVMAQPLSWNRLWSAFYRQKEIVYVRYDMKVGSALPADWRLPSEHFLQDTPSELEGQQELPHRNLRRCGLPYWLKLQVAARFPANGTSPSRRSAKASGGTGAPIPATPSPSRCSPVRDSRRRR